ncbi:MAG TPA: chloride channel protein [Acidimicrobiia bacterium]|nr:chloride channel protein [Acidimicrobiia bacterium]
MSSLARIWRRLPSAVAVADRAGGRFLLLAAATGVTVGIGAWAFVEFLRLFELSPVGEIAAAGDWLVFLFVPLGFLAAWAVARLLAPEVSGDGVPEAAAALIVRGGLIRGRVAPLKILATGLTVGVGGSAGREGPIVLVGASIGSKVARIFNLGEDQVRSLVAAGAGAGIGATFNAPIAGMLFALEVILASFAVRHMSAIVVASVAAAITSRSLVGPGLGLNSASYEMRDARELLLYAGLAIVIVVVSVIFLRLLELAEHWVHQGDRMRAWWRPVGFGLLAAGLLVAEPLLLGTDRARLGGTGQTVTNRLLESASGAGTVGGPLDELWWVLALVALAKVVMTTLTLNSGGSGGAFMPSLFIGAMVGTAFAKMVGPWWGFSAINTGSFAVVGMAAMFAAMGRAPLTAILLVFEVTGTREYGLILPLMATAILATFLSQHFHRESVYTMPLRRRGIATTHRGEVDLLDTVAVGDVMAPARFVVGPATPVSDLRVGLDSYRLHGAPVVEDGSLIGIVTVTDLAPVGDTAGALVGEVMTPRPATVTPSTPVSHAMERMAALGVGRLPVVADADPRQLVGMFRREEAVWAYHEALGARTDHHLERQRLAQRTDPGTGYFDFRIPPGSVADGRPVSDVTWPEGSTLVSIRRGRTVLVPVGRTVLQRDDVVTAFGSEASRVVLIERLNAGADEPTAEIELDFGDEGATGETPTIVPPDNSGDLR